MNVLFETIQLITQPPGDLVYFLVTLFALQQALLPALTARRRAPSAQASRWLGAIAGLLLSRAVLIVIGLLGTVGLLSPAQFLPPLERWLEFAAVLLVIWAAVFGARAARWQTIFIALLLGASLVFYGVTAALWPAWEASGYAFNTLLHERIWEMLTIGFLVLYLLLTLLTRPPEWEWAVVLGLFWLVGHAAQLRWPDEGLHFSGWLRLTALVTLPLLAALVHRQISLYQSSAGGAGYGCAWPRIHKGNAAARQRNAAGLAQRGRIRTRPGAIPDSHVIEGGATLERRYVRCGVAGYG
jgi:hypothetical protein